VLIKGRRNERRKAADRTETGAGTGTGSSQLGSHHGMAEFRFYAFMISRLDGGGVGG